jgi:hypothetical protein
MAYRYTLQTVSTGSDSDRVSSDMRLRCCYPVAIAPATDFCGQSMNESRSVPPASAGGIRSHLKTHVASLTHPLTQMVLTSALAGMATPRASAPE